MLSAGRTPTGIAELANAITGDAHGLDDAVLAAALVLRGLAFALDVARPPRPRNVGCCVALIVWHLLNDPAARYRDLGSGWHARHADRSRNARRQLEALGYDVIITLREDTA